MTDRYSATRQPQVLVAFIFAVIAATDSRTSAAGIPFYENFNSGLPQNWTIIDGPGTPDGKTWTDTNPGGRTSIDWCDGFMIVDSDSTGHVDMDEQLISPVFDFSDCPSVLLTFRHRFKKYGNEVGDVDVRAGDGVWSNVARFTGADA